MLSTIASRTTVPLARRMAPRLVISRGFGIEDTFRNKEKVEEDRYMREQEKKFFERKKAERAEKMHEQEEAIFQETIAPAMAEAEQVLKKTGDKVSDAGLEALARWKLF